MSNVEVAALSRLVAWPNNITALKLPYFNAVVVSHPSAGILMHLCRMHQFFFWQMAQYCIVRLAHYGPQYQYFWIQLQQ